MLICLLIVKQLWIWAASFSFTHLLALKAEWNEKKRYENDTKDSYVEITFKFTESTSFKCSWKKTTKYELQVKKIQFLNWIVGISLPLKSFKKWILYPLFIQKKNWMRTDILMKLAEQQQQQKFNQLTEKSERLVESSTIQLKMKPLQKRRSTTFLCAK